METKQNTETGERFMDIQNIVDWAKQNNLHFDPSKLPENLLDGEFDVMSCLPTSEQDDLQERFNNGEFDALTERQEYGKAMEYFDGKDFTFENIGGFCNSIVDRVIVGKYMAEHNIGYCTLTDENDMVNCE